MYLELLKNLLVTTAVQVILHAVQTGGLCSSDYCLAGAFFFAPGRHMVNSHALLGHVFDNFTVTDPIECFRKCRCDCRCISFNYLTNMIEKNCELNEENRHTNSSALKPVQGSQYYDLVVNYDIKADAQSNQCQNGCCGTLPCLHGGTCDETCDVTKERFTCSCKPGFIGKYCETFSCPTGWLEFNYSCFKKFENSKFWHSAQEACKNLNGSLASIHSSEENQFLYAQLFSNSRLWIGFNDINREGVFEWIDNSYVSFTDWESDEPNDYRNNEDCAAMQAIQWGDYPCRDTYHYLCRIIYE